MSNETEPTDLPAPTPETSNASEPAVAVVDTPNEALAKDSNRLPQVVEISDVGPCKKHVKVTVDRVAIDVRAAEKYKEILKDSRSQLNGFRPGKAPRRIVERRYSKYVLDQVKNEILMASLEQIATENQISPLSPPDLNPTTIDIPAEGPFVYEFDVEVRPEFDLPNYKGLKIRRPVKTITEKDIAEEQRKLLEPAGRIVPKTDETGAPLPIEIGDVIVADVVVKRGDVVLNELKAVQVKVEKQLVLADGVAEKFGESMKGAKVGEKREVNILLAPTAAVEGLRGIEVSATFDIKEVKTIKLPELTPSVLEGFGVATEGALRELLQVVLERRLEYTQRQEARRQIVQMIGESSKWELPRDLLIRQARKTLQRRVLEMKNAGLSDEQITARRRKLEQDAISTTAFALKEHFVLQKVAEMEKLEIEDADIDAEIERIAAQSNESPRKVKARLEKEDMIEAIATELLERKALDLILSAAEYEDVPLTEQDDPIALASIESQAVPGRMVDETASAPAGVAPPS